MPERRPKLHVELDAQTMRALNALQASNLRLFDAIFAIDLLLGERSQARQEALATIERART